MYKTALHPLIDNSSRILILGTMPGDQSIAKQQYYGNKGNHFWKIMFTIFEENYTTSYDDRKTFLKKHKIALWNVLASCIREGSSDSKITNESINDFVNFHIQYPNIKYVFFESKSAAKFYTKYSTPQIGISYYVLPSTSGLNAGTSFSQKVETWKILAEKAANPD
ncbi:DNA-deoxyinosine glycosylase [Flavobacterium hydrophilum]|uniref:DNA-deoxyinosine glycosylase n=1 Tax=Flavobacterium hydrophilum TaxID=2211445 RepID=A0A2V4C8S0_9FLAO|nr:DNA-deoxyinosine glycosylase [Flavobacterium hydrophilum]PXY46360.1 DNA-deoxyinosine glycosylase [Flavobacterium hydrophilum]